MTEEQPTGTDPAPAHGGPFVPAGFVPPTPPRAAAIRLEPLGVQHNQADYAAWTSSMEHIHATPGFEDSGWPHPMTLADNADDLRMHADHFARRLGFTYTVLSTLDDDVVGCVYIYPSKDPVEDVVVRSWVRADRAELDAPLADLVGGWLRGPDWPFDVVRYR